MVVFRSMHLEGKNALPYYGRKNLEYTFLTFCNIISLLGLRWKAPLING